MTYASNLLFFGGLVYISVAAVFWLASRTGLSGGRGIREVPGQGYLELTRSFGRGRYDSLHMFVTNPLSIPLMTYVPGAICLAILLTILAHPELSLSVVVAVPFLAAPLVSAGDVFESFFAIRKVAAAHSSDQYFAEECRKRLRMGAFFVSSTGAAFISIPLSARLASLPMLADFMVLGVLPATSIVASVLWKRAGVMVDFEPIADNVGDLPPDFSPNLTAMWHGLTNVQVSVYAEKFDKERTRPARLAGD